MSATPAAVGRTPDSRRQRLATVTVGLLIADAAGYAIIAALFGWALFGMLAGSSSADISSSVDAMLAVNGVVTFVFVGSAVLFLIWLFRAASTARRFGLGPGTSPWMAVLWWFVPLAWFVMPYRVVRDLHASLAPEDTSFGGRLVVVWWATWLVSWALFGVGWLLLVPTTTMALAEMLAAQGLIYGISLVAVAALSARIVAAVSRGQRALDSRSS